MTNIYLFIKAIHIISFTAWMAGMFYLPRIFVYHSEKKLDIRTYNKFLIMEKKLIKIIVSYFRNLSQKQQEKYEEQ